MGPVSALRELQAVAQAMLSGRGGPNPSNRPSLVNDLSTALNRLGPATRSTAGPVLTDFLRALPELRARLDRPQGARVIALSLMPLLDRLADPEVCRAAWRDAVATFTDVDAPAEECELRVMQLTELAELVGVDYDVRAGTLQYILSDDAALLHKIGAIPDAPQARHSFAGLTEEQRLDLCEERLPKPAERADVAVWFVINEAAIIDGYLRVGPVQLFAAGMVPDAIGVGGALTKLTDDFESLDEAGAWDEVRSLFDNVNPDVKHRLYARVWVPDAPMGVARRRARDSLEAMISVANSESQWVLLDGYATWAKGRWQGSSSFIHPQERRYRPVHAVFDRTAAGLSDFVPAFLDRLLAGDPLAQEAIEDALWTATLSKLPGVAQRIVLAIRALERTLSQAQIKSTDSWAEAASTYLRVPWIMAAIQSDLLFAAHAAVRGISQFDPALDAVRSRVQDAALPVTGPGERTPSAAGLASVAADALNHIEPGTYEHRLVAEQHDLLTSPLTALKRLDDLDKQFDTLLRRSERHRNAIVHGTAIEHDALSTVDDFVILLARLVAQEAMRQAETGKPPLVELERERVRDLDARAGLAAGDGVVEVLFATS